MVLATDGLRHGKHTSSEESAAEVNHCTAGKTIICRNRATMLGLQASEQRQLELISSQLIELPPH